MAIDDLLDEHEQGERVRDWVRRNGVGLVGGVVLGLALIGGWKWWEARAHQQRIQAGEAYQATLEKIVAGDLDAAAAQAAALDGGIYAALAALDLAKAQVDAGKRDAAIATLRGIEGVDPALARLVDQRLARLLIDAGNAQDALQMLGGDDPLSLEIRGDAQVALGKLDLARKEYEAALTRLDVAAPQRRLLEIKLTDVGGVPAQPEA
jgi:predicted negative regulator of RcsB-dependent stress response